MAKKVFALGIFVLGAMFSVCASAQDEATYLNRFEGRWSGAGQVNSMLGPVTLDCTATATARGAQLDIRGECKGSGVTRKLSARLRYDPKAKTYLGNWNDGTGGAALTGTRRGGALALVVGSKSGGTSGRMQLHAEGGAFRLSLQENGAQRVSIAFQRG